jgi:hypothetical protein
MAQQKWKTDSSLHSCKRDKYGHKIMDYEGLYVDEFLNADPLRDWESIDRCKDLWKWSMDKIPYLPHIRNVLDCGTKDGQFPEWLLKTDQLYESSLTEAVGIEISEPYINYAQEKERPVVYGNVCDLPEDWTGKFDFVFSHHLLGLTPDYYKALSEMYRVTSYYMVTLNDVPGNPKKHYSYIDSSDIYDRFIKEFKPEVIFNGFWKDNKEWVLLVRK